MRNSRIVGGPLPKETPPQQPVPDVVQARRVLGAQEAFSQHRDGCMPALAGQPPEREMWDPLVASPNYVAYLVAVVKI